VKENLAIKVSNLGKRYFLGNGKSSSLRETISFFNKGKSTQSEFWALKEISFEIIRGEVLGIVGKNGAGKSTLLKVLSQITTPTIGKIEIFGRIASLLEVGTGFHPELTGRENIFLNGTILGMTRKEVNKKFDEIVEFSGVEKFIDTPVKNYSSGMYVRLAFSVAAHLDPEILVIDEVLAVGDIEFQKKCIGKMHDVSNKGKTVIFVSHNTAVLANLCDRGILLNEGQIHDDGAINDVLQNYLNSGLKYDHDLSKLKRKNSELGSEIKINCVSGWNGFQREIEGVVQETFSGSEYIFRVNYTSNVEIDKVTFALGLFSQDGSIFYTSLRSDCINEYVDVKRNGGSVFFRLTNFPFTGGIYSINIIIRKGTTTFDWIEDACQITVANGDFYHSGILPASGRQGTLMNFQFYSK